MWTRRNTCRTLCALVAALLFAPKFARSEPAFSRTFNGPELAWRILDNGNPSKVLAHDCIPGGARDNSGIEFYLYCASGPRGGGTTTRSTNLDKLAKRRNLTKAHLIFDASATHDGIIKPRFEERLQALSV